MSAEAMESRSTERDQTAGISLVIPVFNEAGHLRRFLEKIDRIRLPLPCELVIVNDGSSDETREIVRQFPFVSPVQVVELHTNNGKGAAVAAGIQRVNHEAVAGIDGIFLPQIQQDEIAMNLGTALELLLEFLGLLEVQIHPLLHIGRLHDLIDAMILAVID